MTRFDTSVLHPTRPTRRPILAVLDAALDAVDPFAAVQNVLQRQGDLLTVADPTAHAPAPALTYDLRRYRRIFVIAAGKAAAPMCRAVESVLQDRISSGLAVTKYGHGQPTDQSATTSILHPRRGGRSSSARRSRRPRRQRDAWPWRSRLTPTTL